jgi:hypothetical protein
MRIYAICRGGFNKSLPDPTKMSGLLSAATAIADSERIFPGRELKCLPLYGDLSAQRRLFDRQRLGLEVRRLAVRRFKNDGSAELDPVLRFHLGLDGKKEEESR